MTEFEKGDLSHSDREISAIDVAVGARLRQRRRERDLTGAQLGALLGLSSMQISKYEHGKHRIAAARLYELASILDVPISYFFLDLPPCGSGNNEPPSDASLQTVGPAKPRLPIEPPLPTELQDLLTLGKLAAKVDDPKEKALIRRLLQRLPIFRDDADEDEGSSNDPN